MDRVVSLLQELAERSFLENYEWAVPETCPISIPVESVGSFERNVYLKEHFGTHLRRNEGLAHHYWLIREWGGIKSLKPSPVNDGKIRQFMSELPSGRLSRKSFSLISSFSKIASFLEPDVYAIYDSRVAYALNWLIFAYSADRIFFPQPTGRNSKLAKVDMPTILNLSAEPVSYYNREEAFHRYCELTGQLSIKVFGPESKPYMMEMLLFQMAPEWILNDIKSRVTIKVVPTA